MYKYSIYFYLLAAIFQAYHGTKKWLKDLEIDLHTFLTFEPNLVSIRRRFIDSFCTSLRGMPGEESAICNNSANDLVFLSDGESLPGDLSDLNFTNPEFSEHVQDGELSLLQSSPAGGD